jgi:hypothetical protein
MTPDEFRRYGHELVEWVAGYMERVAALPVQASVEPGEIRAALPTAPPEDPEPFEALVRDLDDVVLPGITRIFALWGQLLRSAFRAAPRGTALPIHALKASRVQRPSSAALLLLLSSR